MATEKFSEKARLYIYIIISRIQDAHPFPNRMDTLVMHHLSRRTSSMGHATLYCCPIKIDEETWVLTTVFYTGLGTRSLLGTKVNSMASRVKGLVCLWHHEHGRTYRSHDFSGGGRSRVLVSWRSIRDATSRRRVPWLATPCYLLSFPIVGIVRHVPLVKPFFLISATEARGAVRERAGVRERQI